jgi:hypothetical protein
LQTSGHFTIVPQRGLHIVLIFQDTHDGVVTSMPLRARSWRADAASVSGVLFCDLERFWPSRRCHAFDEFCR